MKKFAAALVLAAGFTASANATVVTGAALTTYDQLVTFSEPSLATNTVVTNQYAAKGLTFTALSGGAVRANSCGKGSWDSGFGMSGDTLNTFGPGCYTNGVNDAFSMKFSSNVSAASLSLYSYSNSVGNSIAAFNDGILQERYSFAAYSSFSNKIAFQNLTFDELRFTEGTGNSSYFFFDNVAFVNASEVPEPAPLALFGLGLAGLVALRRKSKRAA